MCEHACLFSLCARKPRNSSHLAAAQAFVFPHGPSNDGAIEVIRYRLPAHCRGEPQQGPAVSTDRASWPECVAKKVELNMLMSFCSLAVLAVHHPCFCRVHLQPAVTKTCRQPLAQIVCLGFAAAVQDAVVSIPTEGNVLVVNR